MLSLPDLPLRTLGLWAQFGMRLCWIAVGDADECRLHYTDVDMIILGREQNVGNLSCFG